FKRTDTQGKYIVQITDMKKGNTIISIAVLNTLEQITVYKPTDAFIGTAKSNPYLSKVQKHITFSSGIGTLTIDEVGSVLYANEIFQFLQSLKLGADLEIYKTFKSTQNENLVNAIIKKRLRHEGELVDAWVAAGQQ